MTPRRQVRCAISPSWQRVRWSELSVASGAANERHRSLRLRFELEPVKGLLRQYRGSARGLPRLRLSPGHHRIELARPGFQPLQKDFDVEADTGIELGLSMEKHGGWKY